MKATMKDVFYHALLARAGYALVENDKDAEIDGGFVTNKLIESVQSKMTEAMADYLMSKFNFVIASQDKDFLVDVSLNHFSTTPVTIEPKLDGYNGLIFQSKADNTHYVLVNRGTEFDADDLERLRSTIADVTSDAYLAMDGYNDQVDTMKDFLDYAKKEGLIGTNATITTTGHSLGGFLSSVAIKDEKMGVNYAYGYNGAGYRPDANLVQKLDTILKEIEGMNDLYKMMQKNAGAKDFSLESLFDDAKLGKAAKALSRAKILLSGLYLGANTLNDALGGDPLSVSGKMTNILTDEGMDLVAGTGVKVGETHKMTADLGKDDGLMAQHAIIPLTDAFVYAYLLNTIDEDMSVSSYNHIVNAMATMPGERLEAMFDYLAKAFIDGKVNGQAKEAIKQDHLFNLINQFETKTDGSDPFSAKIYTLFNSDSAILVDNASANSDNGALMRHALLNRSAFTLYAKPSTDKKYLNKILGNSDYALNHFTDGYIAELGERYDFFKSLVGASQMMYSNHLMTKHNDYYSQKDDYGTTYKYTDGGKGVYVSYWDDGTGASIPYVMFEDINIQFEYERTGKNLSNYANKGYQFTYIGSQKADKNSILSNGDDKYYGLGGDDIIDGNEGDDFINGGMGKDTLIGGTGNDILVGGSGDDVLHDELQTSAASQPITQSNDKLYGGVGDDKLISRHGNDTLVGGTGFDTYDIYGSLNSSGEWELGTKTIIDEDGEGEIKINGKTVQIGARIGGDLYKSTDEKYFIQRVKTGSENNYELKIWTADKSMTGTVIVKGWGQGGLGLSMTEDGEMPTGMRLVDFGTDNTSSFYGLSTTRRNIAFSSKIYNLDDQYLSIGSLWMDTKQDNYYLFGDQHVALKIAAGLGSDVIITGSKNDIIWTDTRSMGWKKSGSDRNREMALDEYLVNELPHDANNKILGNYTNTVDAGAGNDEVVGGYGLDTINGGDGDDLLLGVGNQDEIFGGRGNDLIYGDGVVAKLFIEEYYRLGYFERIFQFINAGGVESFMNAHKNLDMGLINDHTYDHRYTPVIDHDGLFYPLYATNLAYHDNDSLFGDEGDDIIFGGGGSDSIHGGDDNDVISGDSIQIDVVFDTYTGTRYRATDRIPDDFIAYKNSIEFQDKMSKWKAEYSGEDTLFGGDGDDYIYGGSKSDYIEGGEGDDVIYGDGDLDTGMHHRNKALTVQTPYDHLPKGSYLVDNYSTSMMTTNARPRNLAATYTSFTIHGDDEIYGGAGADTIYGDGGSDKLHGGTGNDIIYGDNSQLDDKYHGSDTLIGGAGNDTLHGGAGDDRLEAGSGTDRLYGGDGFDTYAFYQADLNKGDVNHIEDSDNKGAILIDNSALNMHTWRMIAENQWQNLDGSLTLNQNGSTLVLTSTQFGASIAIHKYTNGALGLTLPTEMRENNQGREGGGGDSMSSMPAWGSDIFVVPPITGSKDANNSTSPHDTDNTTVTPSAEGVLGSNNDVSTKNDKENVSTDTVGTAESSIPKPNNGSGASDSTPSSSTVETASPVTEPIVRDKPMRVTGTSANDTLIGGTGNDYLDGSAGADTYVFAKGHGQDVIHDYERTPAGQTRPIDVVRFEDVRSDEIEISLQSNHLVISGYHDGDQLTLQNLLSGTNYQIERFEFSDKTLSLGELLSQHTTYGTAYNDHLNLGMWENVTIDGAAGNDTITTGKSNDTLIGGEGEDRLNANEGDDILNGGTGNDTLHAGAGNDTLIGGTGNDYLDGSAGADTYVFAKGHGQDVIHDYEYVSTIQDKSQVEIIKSYYSTAQKRSYTIGGNESMLNHPPRPIDIVRFDDVSLREVSHYAQGNDLILTGYHEGDKLTLQNFFMGESYQIERFEFSDGVISADDLKSHYNALKAVDTISSKNTQLFNLSNRQIGGVSSDQASNGYTNSNSTNTDYKPFEHMVQPSSSSQSISHASQSLARFDFSTQNLTQLTEHTGISWAHGLTQAMNTMAGEQVGSPTMSNDDSYTPFNHVSLGVGL